MHPVTRAVEYEPILTRGDVLMSNRVRETLLIILFAAAAVAQGATVERPPLAQTMRQVAGAPNYLETAISPDAGWIAWSQSSASDGKTLSVGSVSRACCDRSNA